MPPSDPSTRPDPHAAETAASEHDDRDAVVTLPPLPAAGFRPSEWTLTVLAWHRIALVSGLALAALAVVHGAWGLGALCTVVPVVAAAIAAPRFPSAEAMMRSALLPAVVDGREAIVLVRATPRPDGWDAELMRAPLLSVRRSSGDRTVCGWLVERGVLGPGFVPAAALVPRALTPLASAMRVPVGYFELLEGWRASSSESSPRTERLDRARAARIFGAAGRGDAAAPRAVDDARAWCAGLVEISRDLLHASERVALRRMLRRERALGALFALHTLLLPTSIAGLVLADSGHAPPALFGASLVGAAVWTAYAVSFRDAFVHLRCAWRLDLDLHDGTARVFQGAPADQTIGDAVAIARAGLTAPDSTRLRVAPRSRAVLSLDDAVACRLSVVAVAELAPAVSTIELSIPGVADERFRRRRMSAAERDELARHVRAIRPFPLGPTAIYLACTALVAGLARVEEPGIVLWWWSGVWLVASLGCAVVVFARWRRQVALERDLDVGWIVVVDAPTGGTKEILPRSGASWSLGGVPAPWRRANAQRH